VRACSTPLGNVIRRRRALVNVPVDGPVAHDLTMADDQIGLRVVRLPDRCVRIGSFASRLLIVA
jgi:hypothetical protein